MQGVLEEVRISTPASTSSDPAPQLAPGRLAVLRGRQFRLLLAGQAVSQLGDRLVMVAMPFAVLSLPGAGPSDVGLVLGTSALLLGVFVLVGGVVADRLPRRRTMLASDVVRALTQAASAALLLSGHASVLSLALLQGGYGAAEAFFRPAALGLVPQVVRPGEEQPANALLALGSTSSLVLGPVLAGVLVALTGPGATLAVDAGTFVVSALTLLLLRPRETARDDHAEPFAAQLAGGWREVRSRSWVWSTLLAFGAYHALVLPALFVLGPQYAQERRGGASAWGVISAGFGLGAVLGSVVALRVRPSRPGVLWALTLAAASCQAVIVVTPVATIAVSALEAVTGVCVSLAITVWETALQQRVPEQAQSRVSSFDYLGSVLLMPLGYVLVGPVAQALGVGTTGLVTSGVTLAVCLLVARGSGLRGLRRVVPG